MNFKGTLLILFTLIYSTGLFAQTDCHILLSGSIIGADTQETVPLATVEVVGTGKSAVADENGKFKIDNLCKGNYQLIVRFVGYQTKKEFVEISGNQEIKIELSPEVKDLEEVTVEGNKVEEIATLKRNALQKEELFQRGGESLGKSLSGISGVNMLQTGPNIAKPVIHGLHSNRILILNNGIRQEGQQWGQEHAPEIDPFVATNLELIKGAAAVKYGSDAIGGVILVNPPDLPDSGAPTGSANLVLGSNNQMYTGSIQVEGGVSGIKGLGWRAQTSYKKAGDARSANYRLTNTGTLEHNFSLGLGYHKERGGLELFFSSFDAQIGILRSAHIGNLSDLEKAIGSDRPLIINDFSYEILNPHQHVKHQLLKVNGHLDSDLGEFTVQYGLQHNERKEYDIRRGGRSKIPALSLELITHTLELDLNTKTVNKFKGDFGASFLYQGNTNNPETGIRPLIPNFDNWTAGAHAIGRYIEDKYELEAGLRYDFKHYLVKRFDSQKNLLKPEFNFSNVTGSIGALFFLNSSWSLRSNLGTAWRAPHINELYSGGLHHGSATIEEGRDDLASEKAIKWITDLEHNSDKYSFNLAFYYNYIRDYIFLRPEDVALTIQGAFPLLRYTQTDASFVGIDADLDYHLTEHFDVKGKLSLIRAEDLVTHGPLISIPANRLNAGITYHFNEGKLKEPFVTFSADFVDKQRNAPRVVTIEEILEADKNDQDLFANDQTVFDLTAPPSGYINLAISAGFKVPLAHNDLSVFVSGENILNNEYRDYMNRLRYYAADMGRNISLKLNYTF